MGFWRVKPDEYVAKEIYISQLCFHGMVYICRLLDSNSLLQSEARASRNTNYEENANKWIQFNSDDIQNNSHIISVTLQMLPALQQLSTFRESAQSFALALEQEPEPVHSSTILSWNQPAGQILAVFR